MKRIDVVRYIIAIVFTVISIGLFGQAPGCPNIDAGPDQNLTCGNNCVTLNANVFETGASTDYSVASINYAPPYSFTGGTQLFINSDDVWGPAVTLPFNFCFYGNMYNQIVVGANGVLTFDLSHANGFCAWSFNSPIPTPGPPPGIYNNSINGAFHDIDPSTLFSSPNINYAILGTAPCRSLVVNYYDVDHYDCESSLFGAGLRTTQQIVLYETTNVIEVYIDDKPTCTGWNSGNAVIGLQNIDGTQGITPPGRNTGPWTANNEAWQFTPNGITNTSVKWYDDNMNLVSTNLALSVCPTSTTTYTAEGIYDRCDGTQIIVQDQVTLTVIGGFTTNPTSTNESCFNTCDGLIDITTTGGTPPFTFDIGNGNQSTGNFPGLCSGTYTVSVSDGSGCSGTLNFILEPVLEIVITELLTNVTCANNNDGEIDITVTGGTTPYTYIWSNTATTEDLTGLSGGIYDLTVTDINNCFTITSYTITEPIPVDVQSIVTDISCFGYADGSIDLTTSGGTLPYTFLWSNNNSTEDISGLIAGSYTLTLTDGSTCSTTNTYTIIEPALFDAQGVTVDVSCFGLNDGSIDLSPTGGTLPYTFLWSNTAATEDVSSLVAGVYTITITDGGNCQITSSFTINEPTEIIIGSAIMDLICPNDNSGAIDLTVSGGTLPYTYIWSNTATTEDLSGISGGIYTVTVTDGNNCTETNSISIFEPTEIDIQANTQDVTCNGLSDAAIDITVSGGTSPYIFNWSNNEVTEDISGLIADTYTITITDDNGCTTEANFSPIEPDVLTISIDTIHASCNENNASIYITVAGGFGTISYNWSDGTDNPYLSNIYAGNYSVTVTDANNCNINADVDIHDTPDLIVEIGEYDTLIIGDSLIITPAYSDTVLINSIYWSPNNTLSCDDCQEPIAFPLTTTTYDLEVEDIYGCNYIDTVEIIVYSNPKLYIPNIFTPNGDGRNDEFYIYGQEIKRIQLMIFSRWGEKVFETRDKDKGWDGAFKGKIMDSNVFVYQAKIVYLSGKYETRTGSVTLIK